MESKQETTIKDRIRISVVEENKDGVKSQKEVVIDNYKGWIIVALATIVATVVLGFLYFNAA